MTKIINVEHKSPQRTQLYYRLHTPGWSFLQIYNSSLLHVCKKTFDYNWFTFIHTDSLRDYFFLKYTIYKSGPLQPPYQIQSNPDFLGMKNSPTQSWSEPK